MSPSVYLVFATLFCASTVSAFAPLAQHLAVPTIATTLAASAPHVLELSSMSIAASTVDPTAFLADLLGGLLGTPAILAIPIVAALLVASAIAFFIVSYANPVEDE